MEWPWQVVLVDVTEAKLLRMTNVDDQLAVRNLLARITYEGDSGDLDAYLTLFDDDAVWAMPGVQHRGLDAIRRGVEQRRSEGLTGPGSKKRHVLTTVEVTVKGDEATARSTWLLVGGDGSQPALLHFGIYDDRLQKSSNGWLMVERSITFGPA
jgi:uncharacterized protein (TIGR02246 family)